MVVSSLQRFGLIRITAGLVMSMVGMIPSPAHADLYCTGKITSVLMYNDGSVMVVGSWRNDLTKLCNTQDGTVPTEVCVSWYAAALKARTENSTVSVYYYGPSGSPAASCAALPTYGATPLTAYFGVIP
jgi:hypothetical protein